MPYIERNGVNYSFLMWNSRESLTSAIYLLELTSWRQSSGFQEEGRT